MNSELQETNFNREQESEYNEIIPSQSPDQEAEPEIDCEPEQDLPLDWEQDQSPDQEAEPEIDCEPEQDLPQNEEQDSEQIRNPHPEKYGWTENLTSILAGVAFAVIVAVGAILVMNGLLIKAKETDGTALETVQDASAEEALAAENVALTLSEDLLLGQENPAENAASGEESGTQEETEEDAATEETDLLDDFVDRYGTVVPRDLTDSECVEALAKLAEQYPEFEEIYENWEDYSILYLVALCNNPEMIDYVKGSLDADTETAGELTEAEVNRDFPYYLQWDSRWGYLSYGETNIGLSGCGPTCLSMVVVALTRNADASPAAVAEYAMEHGYYINGSGTAWSLMTTGASHYGITSKDLSTSTSEDEILALLEDGCPIICSVRPGDFTKGGHFIVLAGVEDGQIRVHDPNSVERSSRLWDYETLRKQIKKMWVFEAAQ